jgi:four helix bundle protein
MPIEKFEEIKAWQEARTLTKQIYKYSIKEGFRKDFGLKDQIQRASTSIMANISEGFDSQSKKEFIHFLTYARRSTSEVQSHLYVAFDQTYITRDEFDACYTQAVRTKNLIGGFIRYLDGKKYGLEPGSTEAPEPDTIKP